MSRFNNLEFGEPRHSAGQGAASSKKDELHYLAEAEASFRRGRFEQALRSYARALEFDPDCSAAWVGQVRMLIELGDAREARLWADKALERFPQDAELLAAKAVAVGRCGDTAAALAFSDAAVERQGESPYVWVARGDVLLAKDVRRAESCFDRALAMATDWVVPWLISRVQHYYGRFAAALKAAHLAVERGATEAICWVQVGVCQHALGLVTPARQAFEQARQLDPECPDAADGLLRLREIGWLKRVGGQVRRWFTP